MIASVASVAFSASDSNQRSRIGLGRSGQDLERAAAIAAERPEAPPELGELEQVTRSRRPRVGRRLDQRRLDHARDPFEHGLVARERLGVLRRELPHLAGGHRLVGPHQQRPAVRQRREAGRAARNHREPVAGQIEVAHDLGAEQAVDVAGRGDLETGPRLFGDDAPADERAPLQDEHRAARSRQIGGRHQAVVPGADDDDIEAGRHDAGMVRHERMAGVRSFRDRSRLVGWASLRNAPRSGG